MDPITSAPSFSDAGDETRPLLDANPIYPSEGTTHEDDLAENAENAENVDNLDDKKHKKKRVPALTPRQQELLDMVPRLDKRLLVMTGADGGIGSEVTAMLASKGARIVMASLHPSNAEKVKRQVVERVKCNPNRIVVVPLDLSNFASVRSFRSRMNKALDKHHHHVVVGADNNNEDDEDDEWVGVPPSSSTPPTGATPTKPSPAPPIHGLLCIAGVMGPYERVLTTDGHERMLQINAYGHFLLTASLFPQIVKARGRVMYVASILHVFADPAREILNDVDYEHHPYGLFKGYANAKLGVLWMAARLARKCRENDVPVTVTASHPGWVDTDMMRFSTAVHVSAMLFAQSPANGALPLVRSFAAMDDDLKRASSGGEANDLPYFGPRLSLWGWPEGKAFMSRDARSLDMQDRFWSTCESIVGRTFDVSTSSESSDVGKVMSHEPGVAAPAPAAGVASRSTTSFPRSSS